MSQAQIGQKIVINPIESTSSTQFSSEMIKGKKVILYFYPKDSTPGCTSESIDFTSNYDAIQKKNAVVFGISRDSIQSHENFKTKYNMPFELISDPDEILCNYFDVIKEKNMYGRKYMGIERSTFLIDENGLLKKEWRKVKVKGHVNEVLQALDE